MHAWTSRDNGEAVREELYWCLYNSSLLTMRGDLPDRIVLLVFALFQHQPYAGPWSLLCIGIARWLRLHGFAELCIQPLWLLGA